MSDTIHATAEQMAESFERLRALRTDEREAGQRYNAAKEETKRLKEDWEEAQAALALGLDREFRQLDSVEERPLISQAEHIERQIAQPWVRPLLARLQAVGQAADEILVANLTEVERSEIDAWLRAIDDAGLEAPRPPKPLILQSDEESDDVDPTTLRNLLALVWDEGENLPSLAVLANWTAEDRLQARTWARSVAEARSTGADGGEVVSLPQMPAIVQAAAEQAGLDRAPLEGVTTPMAGDACEIASDDAEASEAATAEAEAEPAVEEARPTARRGTRGTSRRRHANA